MNIPSLAIRFCAGLALAGMFYGGLWLTVQRVVTARHPAALALSSLFVRSSLAAAGFVWLSGGMWQNLLACLLGFEVGRLVIMRARRCI
jgi:F1F0 ATPase subunit 2